MGPAATEKNGALLKIYLEQKMPLLRYLARLTRSTETAEDLAQEAFAKLLKYRPTDIHSVGGLLFTTARHLAIDHLRRELIAATGPLSAAADLLADPGPSHQSQLVAREGFRALCDVLDKLPLRQRQVFTLRKVYNLSHSEIAAELGISESTAQKHLTKALEEVRASMRERNLGGE